MTDNISCVLNTVRDTINRNNMIAENQKVLVALSGGADSVCLLHVLYSLRNELGIEIFAAHLNHLIRGDEAERDENFVKELCEGLGVKVFFRHSEVQRLAAENKLTVEEMGRKERYRFFSDICKEHNIDKIATAHNRNDLAETVLMRIIRGTGLDGLVGIKYVREDNVIRPILDVSRSDIEKYCEENGLEFCTDSTNSDNDYTRNKIRNELIPYLKDNFNPKILDSLANLSANVSQDAEFINEYAKRLYERINNPLPSHKPYALHIESMRFVDRSILTRLIRHTVKKCFGYEVNLEKKHIDDIIAAFEKETGFGIDLPEGIRCEVQYGWLVFKSKDEIETVKKFFGEDFYAEVDLDKVYEIDGLNKKITFKIKENPFKLKSGEIALNLSMLEGKKLYVRNRRNGDKIVRFKDGRTKKIKNVFIDMKIPREGRDSIPLICADDEIAGILGVTASEKYKFSGFSDNNKKALVISCEKC